MTNCLNCNTEVHDKFCPHCGQSATVSKITFKETFEHFLSSSFSLEGPFLFTIKSLLIKPGLVFKEYLAGCRKKYYRPVAFFILITAFYLIIRSLLKYDPLEGLDDQTNNVQFNELKQKSLLASRFMVKNINNIMFLLALSIGLMMKLFYHKRYLLAEYMAIAFYITGLYVLSGIFTMLISYFAGNHFNNIQLLVLICLIYYSSASFFGIKNIWQGLKIFLMSFFSFIFYLIMGYGLSFLVISL